MRDFDWHDFELLAAGKAPLRPYAEILVGMSRAADEWLQLHWQREANATPPELLFDLLMQRYDLLAPAKPGLRQLLRVSSLPQLGFAPAQQLYQSVKIWLRLIGGADTTSRCAELYYLGLMAIYVDSSRIWLADDSPDLARTMKHLDQRLRQAGELAKSLHL